MKVEINDRKCFVWVKEPSQIEVVEEFIKNSSNLQRIFKKLGINDISVVLEESFYDAFMKGSGDLFIHDPVRKVLIEKTNS